MVDILKYISKQKIKNRLSHAYIINSPNHQLLKDYAIKIAKEIICDSPDELVYKQIDDHSFLNLIYIKKEDDKLSIQKEEIEKLLEEFSKTSLLNYSRVYIVDLVDDLTVSSQNTLLKFIEEPQENVYAILLSKDINHILDTIKSRAQILYLSDIIKTDFIKDLKKEYPYDYFYMLSFSDYKNYDKLLEDKKYISFKELINNFFNIKNKKDGVIFYYTNQNIDYNTFDLFINFLIRFYDFLIKDSTLLPTELILNIKQKDYYNDLVKYGKILNFLLDIQNKLYSNCGIKGLFNQLITYL